jgi:antitoxin MazE
MTTTLRKWGNSLGVRLPREILKEALFSENERVELIADKTGIRIQKIDKIETLDDLFKGYNGNYAYHDIDTGNPVGNEVW